MTFKIAFDESLVLDTPGFDEDDLVYLAEVGLESQKRRIAAGVNVNDQPAQPLSKSWRKAKLRRGKSGIRDLRFTGALLDNLGVRESDNESATIGFTDPWQATKAAINQDREAMFGLSDADVANVDEAADRLFARKIRRLAA